MHELPHENAGLEKLDVAVIQGSRHGLAFARSMLAGLKIGRYRSYLSAERALRDMKNDPPGLVLTDWELKARGGYWLVSKVRRAENEALRAIPILVLTSEISPPMLDVVLETGANSVLIKPVSAATLRERITALVNQPQPLVEHGEGLIPEAAKEALETRLRPHETASTRASRMQLREAFETTCLGDGSTPEAAPTADVPDSPEPAQQDSSEYKWGGWEAA